MKKYNKENGRKNMRLQGYDYSREGLYFLTIVVQNRLHLFGHVKNGKMILNDAGQMVEKWYREIENKYPDKRCHEMVVMPNHFHCIIENVESVNTDKYSDGYDSDAHMDAHDSDMHMDAHDSGMHMDAHIGAPLRGRPPLRGHPNDTTHPDNDNKYGIHNKKYGATIGDVMDWFKTMTTNEYIRGVKNHGWRWFEKKLWQRNYYDHIIRNSADVNRIATYIIENPKKWNDDRFHGNN